MAWLLTTRNEGPNHEGKVEDRSKGFSVPPRDCRGGGRGSGLECSGQRVVGAHSIPGGRQACRSRHGHGRLCHGRVVRDRPISEGGTTTSRRSWIRSVC